MENCILDVTNGPHTYAERSMLNMRATKDSVRGLGLVAKDCGINWPVRVHVPTPTVVSPAPMSRAVNVDDAAIIIWACFHGCNSISPSGTLPTCLTSSSPTDTCISVAGDRCSEKYDSCKSEEITKG